jgi:hypothetical protein
MKHLVGVVFVSGAWGSLVVIVAGIIRDIRRDGF